MGRYTLCLCAVLLAAGGCNIRQYAIDQLADALSSGGGSAFASDDDPELIRQALPFSLKLLESLLAESPRHRGLLTSLCSGFAQYAYAFVMVDAEMAEERSLAEALAMRDRARGLLLRAREYGLRALEIAHPGFRQALMNNPREAVKMARAADVELLYWTGAAWALAIAVSKDRPDLIADQPRVEALLDRAMELNEAYGEGALRSVMISYEPSRQGATEPYEARCRRHFERAVAQSGGNLAAPYVAYAEAVCLQKLDRRGFEEYLKKALAVDVNARPEWRLANVIIQRRAKWLLSRVDELFVE